MRRLSDWSAEPCISVIKDVRNLVALLIRTTAESTAVLVLLGKLVDCCIDCLSLT